eukprot:TRINITY_DN87562_c0_g1_i1.p2 TRINITY_DN87562_c0_g1~~TRINITY_DN87562_c0_g1_i1.p2  ORF type:complete len:220 (-),score=60.78 TRINITY_DN87562_c0_g1_i1:72-731(-)
MKSMIKCFISGLAVCHAVHLLAQPADKAAPVAQQVSEEDMKNFTQSLSKGCAKQFSAMLAGEGPALHTFGETDSSEESCNTLHGHLCSTEAHVNKEVEFPNGRTGKSTNSMTGHSCLPKDCVSEDDLRHLASFMKSRAKQSLPDKEVDIILNLDCSKAGGAKYPVAAKAVDKKAKQAKPEKKTEGHTENPKATKAATSKPEDVAGLSSLRGFGAGKSMK